MDEPLHPQHRECRHRHRQRAKGREEAGDDAVDDSSLFEHDVNRAREADQQRGEGEVAEAAHVRLRGTAHPESADHARHDPHPEEQRREWRKQWRTPYE